MHRLFVALRPPALIREALLARMHGVEGARWQDDDQLHLTLRFIGVVDAHVADDIATGLSRVLARPVTLQLKGVGKFDRQGRVDALWAGVTPHDDLAALHRKIDRVCQSISLPPDHRAYLPHITLARINRLAGPVDAFLARESGLTSAPFTLSHFDLYESHLGSTGAVYHLVERYPLG